MKKRKMICPECNAEIEEDEYHPYNYCLQNKKEEKKRRATIFTKNNEKSKRMKKWWKEKKEAKAGK